MRGVGEPFGPDVESNVTHAMPTGSDVYVELVSWKYVPISVQLLVKWNHRHYDLPVQMKEVTLDQVAP
jgi:hypothetical protein